MILRLGQVASTMDEARALAHQGAAHGTCVLAESQRAGRGRTGSGWHSPPGNLYATTILYAPPRADVAALSPLLALACAEALAAWAPIVLKWPNDLLWRGRKVAGLLLQQEAVGATGCCLLVGLGLNCAPLPAQGAAAAFGTPGALPRGDLSEAAGRRVTPAEVEDAVCGAILAAYDGWLLHGLSQTDRRRFDVRHALQGQWVVGEAVAAPNAAAPAGYVTGLAACGGLDVRDDSGHKTVLRTGAVRHMRPAQSPLPRPCPAEV